MTWGDIKVVSDADETEYLDYSERHSETRTGAEPRNYQSSETQSFS